MYLAIGVVADFLRKHYISTTATRKLITFFGNYSFFFCAILNKFLSKILKLINSFWKSGLDSVFFQIFVLVYFPAAACLIAVNFIGCDQTNLSISLMVLAYVFLAMNQGIGFLPIIYDKDCVKTIKYVY